MSLLKGEAGDGRGAIKLAVVGLHSSFLNHWSGPTAEHARAWSQPLLPPISGAGLLWRRSVGADISMKHQAG